MHFAGNSIRAETHDPELVAYLAMGGSLDDLCVTDDGAHNHANCPFCRELDIFELASHVPCPVPVVEEKVIAVLPPQVLVTGDTHHVRPRSRAPPFS
ncbi:hypothetical protein GCM10007385_08450 [Tateyamaria omphalii]|nr:hypothetical protein GCM10007385_08450 [Tateyamaria omphalii]